MIPTSFRDLWFRLTRLGTGAGMDPRQAKRIVLANQFALFIPFTALVSLPMHWLQGNRASVYIGLFALAAFPLTLRLHGAAGHPFARLYLVTVGNAVMLLHCLTMGMETNMHLFFGMGAWMGMILFGPGERRAVAYSLLLPTALFAGFVLFDRAMGGWRPLPPERAAAMAVYNLIATQVVQVAGIAYFWWANHRTEGALAAAGEAAQAADRAKSRFLANMSHEVRTPLNGILGLSELLLREGLPPRQRETLLGIHSSALDLLGLVNDLLDLSRIEAGAMRLGDEPFRLRPLVGSLLAPFRLVAERKRLALDLDVAGDVPEAVSGDAIRLKQVLNNLVGNALKFTEAGSVTLRVRLAADAERPAGPGACARLRFEVEDTGIGIPESARPEMFRPFSQADASASRRHEGAGLGLSISRQIVERMGGSIGYASRPGHGSLFHVDLELPVAEPPADAGAAEAGAEWRPGAAAEPALAGLGILIVEDNVLNRKVISGMLAARGLAADEAHSGAQGLEVFARGTYGLIFTDVHMPGMDGFEFTRRLRALAGSGPMVVGVTADALAESREGCLRCGMDDVLTKPVLARDLDALLRRLPGMRRHAAVLPGAEGPRAPEVRSAGDYPAPARGADRQPDESWMDGAHFRELQEWVEVHDKGFWDRGEAQFRADVARLVGAAREALAEGRRGEAADAAHSLKGVSLMLGFRRMGRLGKDLEDGIKAGSADLPERLAALEAGLEPSVRELRARLRGEGPAD